ncbi:PucR family transcriptional regulator [Nocardia rhizosphaerae]|uniref:PucR family transcriptional regulator n=1 Tax=Nocardia rhizosphaerae TaxID=1691571 RepID=A0ABV8LDV3_9NOCA
MTARLLSRWPQISERMLADGLVVTAPADLPADHFTAEVLPTIYACGRAVLQAIAADRVFTHAEVAAFVRPVAERHAEDRLPLPMLINAIHGSSQAVLAELAAVTGPREQAEFGRVFGRLLEILQHINATVVATYTEVEEAIYNDRRRAHRELYSALARGLPAEELATDAGTALTDHYTVLTIRLDDPSTASTAATLVTRRRIRVLQHALDDLTGTMTPASFDGTQGIALLSDDVEIGDALDDLAVRLSKQFGTTVHLAEFTKIARERIPAAIENANELTELAHLRGLASGCYRLDDLLLDYQLTRPGPARERLARQMIPLLDNPHLVAALEAHLRHGSNRKPAAREIHVHPNTYTYRLRRIREITGLDPADPAESRVLAAAFAIHTLRSPGIS